MLPKWFVGELVGTFVLIFFGCGAVCAAVLTGAQVGIFQVAIVWGVGIAIAVYVSAALSGAHLNPAVTVGLACWSGFPTRRVVPYVLAQLLGAFLAAAVLFLIFRDAIAAYEKAQQIVRGQPGSEATAMIFGEYFPNPGGKPLTAEVRERMSHGSAFVAEVIGTAVLMFVIGWAGDERQKNRPGNLVPVFIGLTVTLLISLLGPLTMACFNPARDLGPRLFSAMAGWGSVPFTTNGLGWLTVYLVAPTLGAVLGGGLYRALPSPAEAKS